MQQYWYSTSIDSDNPTLGHKIFAIKSMGVFEVFLVILVKLDQQIHANQISMCLDPHLN